MADKYHQVYVEYKQRAETRIAQLEAERDAAYRALNWWTRESPTTRPVPGCTYWDVIESARKLTEHDNGL
jgi:hypothetical protein